MGIAICIQAWYNWYRANQKELAFIKLKEKILKTITVKKQELIKELVYEISNKYCKSLSDFKLNEFLDVYEVGEDNDDNLIYGVDVDHGENGTLNFKGIEYKFSFTQNCRVEGTLEELKEDTFTRYCTNFLAVNDLEVNGEAADEELVDAINEEFEDFVSGEYYPNFATISSAQTARIVKHINKEYINKELS